MEALKKQMMDIPPEQLEDMDALFFRQIKMDEDKARKRFQDLIEETKAKSYERIHCQGVFHVFDIKDITESSVMIEGGEKLKSRMLAQVLERSEKIAVYALTAHGHEELEDNAEGIMRNLFYDAWGTAFVEASTTWYRKQLEAVMKPQGFNMTYSWSPGQHQVDITLQRPVFRMIEPERIGMRLGQNMMMHPKKSATGIIGIGTAPDLAQTRACDFCDLRQTCPSAYAVEG